MGITLTRPASSSPGEGTRPDAATPKLLELAAGVAADLGRLVHQPHAGARAVTLEPTSHHEAVAAVAPLATDDDDPGAAARRAESRERGDDRVGGAAAGVLHQGGPGDAEIGDRPLIEPPHLLGGEDAQHGYFPVGGVTA